MPATRSLLGLYNWDSTSLDGLIVPAEVDRQTVINNLLRECAELEVLYPQPEALKFFVAEWSKERLPVWERLARTLKFEYDPISNYDRREEWTDEGDEDRREQNSGSSSGESSTQTAGFNSSAANVPESQTESRAEISGETQSSASRTTKRIGRAYGNIGVTTTQQMIEEERRISEFDIDDIIIQEFKKTFCILIY